MTKEEKKQARLQKRQARKQQRIDKKDKYYLEKYGVTYSSLVKKNDKGENKENKKILNSLLRSERKVIILCYFSIALFSTITFAPAYFFQKYNTYLTLGNWDEAIVSILIYIGLFSTIRLSGILMEFFLRRANARIICNIRSKMNEKILNAKYESFKLLNTGEVLNKLTSNLSQYIENSLDIIRLASGIIGATGVVIYATVVAPWLSLMLFVIGFARWIFNLIYSNKVSKRVQKRDNAINDKISGVNTESVRGMQDVKLLNIKEDIFAKILTLNGYKLNAEYDSNNKRTLQETINYLILATKEILMFVSIAIFLKNNLITLGTAMLFYAYRGNFENLFISLSLMQSRKVKKDVAGSRLCEILNENTFPIEVFGRNTIKDIKGEIEFKDVCFAYSVAQGKKGAEVLNKLNFVVEPNKCVGIVGESGVGKTTIINLIPRLYDCDSGCVLLDGQDVKTLNEATLRGAISVVSQNPYIFNVSFAENLRVVKKDATDEELIEVARRVNLDDVILSREEGLDTKLGEGGLQLSGGQRQRLAIARALLRNTKVLIFDEATSALDNENQKEIQNIISELQTNHTIIIIAHRLSTIVNCDKLIYIENGAAVMEGTHKELMKNCLGYKNLYKIENKIG